MGERADTYPPAQVAQTGTLEGHRRGDPRGHRPRVGPRGLRGGDDEPDRRGFGLYGVGSLYDYFPNKESLVVALIERHAEEMVEVAEATFRAHEDSALNVAVRAWVEAGVRAHLASPELHKVLVEQVPKVGDLDRIGAFEDRIAALVHAYLERHAGEVRPQDLPLTAFVVAQALVSLTHKAVAEKPGIVEDGRLVDEISELVLGYLTPANAKR